MNMNAKQFKKRRAEVLRKEFAEPEGWMYLSFADEKFRGVVVIKAHGLVDAISRTHALGINPGGQVMGVDMPDEIVAQVPEDCRTRLLTKAEVQRIWPDAKSLRERQAEHCLCDDEEEDGEPECLAGPHCMGCGLKNCPVEKPK